MSQHIVAKSISVKAEPAKVWEALTNPEKTKNYFFHSRVLSDWQPGSTITFKGKMFYIIPFEMTGRILNVEPGRFLQYTLKNGKKDDASAGYSTVTETLTYENGETLVSVTDDVGDGDDAGERYHRSQKGWDKILSGLKKEVES
ncbi:MAG: hypothetical protein JWO03_1935 [Bacteroidetes bacterium]|nr:hypothetical protein [Bacteroidota bacterium]